MKTVGPTKTHSSQSELNISAINTAVIWIYEIYMRIPYCEIPYDKFQAIPFVKPNKKDRQTDRDKTTDRQTGIR